MNWYVILRGGIYVSLAVLTAFSGWLERLTPEKIANLTWYEWTSMAVAVVISGLVALRAFIDGSAQRDRSEAETKKDQPNG